MSRKEYEDLVVALEAKRRVALDTVTLDIDQFELALEGLKKLEQALDNRPSLIKKLNEKITGLEAELELLRDQTRVNELERKVQRLEAELKQSYATKNYAVKTGLLDIEKRYSDYIRSSPDIAELWDEITLLLIEDRETLPKMRHTPSLSHHHTRNISLGHMDQYGSHRSSAQGEPGASSALGPLSEAGELIGGQQQQSASGVEGPEGYVHQQVERLKDATLPVIDAGGVYLGASASMQRGMHARSGSSIPTSPQHAGGEFQDGFQIKYGPEPDVLVGPHVEELQKVYQREGLVPLPGAEGASYRMLRPASLFKEGTSTADASSLQQAHNQLGDSIAYLRSLFNGFMHFPPGHAMAGSAEDSAAAAAAVGAEVQLTPDASALVKLDEMAWNLQASVEQLRRQYGQLGISMNLPGGDDEEGKAREADGRMADARYFDKQAESALAALDALRRLWAALAAKGDIPGAPDDGKSRAGAGADGAASAADVEPFLEQTEALGISVQQLMDLIKRAALEAGASPDALLKPGSGPYHHQQQQAQRGSMTLSPHPLARGMSGGSAALSEASVAPLIAVFSSFLNHLAAHHKAPRTPSPGPSTTTQQATNEGGEHDAAAAAAMAAAAAGVGAGAFSHLSVGELLRLYDEFVRTSDVAPAALRSLASPRTPSGSRAASVSNSGFAFGSTGGLGGGFGGFGALSPTALGTPRSHRGSSGMRNLSGRLDEAAAGLFGANAAAAAAKSKKKKKKSKKKKAGDAVVEEDFAADAGENGSGTGAAAAADVASASAAGADAAASTMKKKDKREKGTGGRYAAMYASSSKARGNGAAAGADDGHYEEGRRYVQEDGQGAGAGAGGLSGAPGPQRTLVVSAGSNGGAAGARALLEELQQRHGGALESSAEAQALWRDLQALLDDGTLAMSAPSTLSAPASKKRSKAERKAAAAAAATTAGGGGGAAAGGAAAASSSGAGAGRDDESFDAEGGAERAARARSAAGAAGTADADGADNEVPLAAELSLRPHEQQHGGTSSGAGNQPGTDAATGSDTSMAVAAEASGAAAGHAHAEAGADAPGRGVPGAAADAGAGDSDGDDDSYDGGMGAEEGSTDDDDEDSDDDDDYRRYGDEDSSDDEKDDSSDDGSSASHSREDMAAELEALHALKVNMAEQLAASQDVVAALNSQLKASLEREDEVRAAVERLSLQVRAAEAARVDSVAEADAFMRELVAAKVQLAEVQGEYMQVFQALKRALGNEKGMLAKIDELERVLAVVGPGDVVTDASYSAAVTPVTGTATPPPKGSKTPGGVPAMQTPKTPIAHGGGGGSIADSGSTQGEPNATQAPQAGGPPPPQPQQQQHQQAPAALPPATATEAGDHAAAAAAGEAAAAPGDAAAVGSLGRLASVSASVSDSEVHAAIEAASDPVHELPDTLPKLADA